MKHVRNDSRALSAIALTLVSCWLALAGVLPARGQESTREEPPAPPIEVVDGVTFAEAPHTLWAPVREIATALGWALHWDAERGSVSLDDRPIAPADLGSLPAGARLIRVRALEGWQAQVAWDGEQGMARIARDEREIWVRDGAKRVAINQDTQRLRAWQGERLVLETRVSTGRPEMPTPNGSFTAGPLKRPMLISRKYGNAEMPWSVQIRGDYVIHGFHSVPPRAASHGCVRVPLTGTNPAKWLYEWIEVGTPIRIANDWPE